MYQSYIGHSHEVTCVRFSSNRRYVVSLGGADQTILIWNHDIEIVDDSDDMLSSHESDWASSESDTEIKAKSLFKIGIFVVNFYFYLLIVLKYRKEMLKVIFCHDKLRNFIFL
jgi:WD40 repeat protein